MTENAHGLVQVHLEELVKRLDHAEELTETMFATLDELLSREVS